MTYRGTVKGGVVVFEGSRPADGVSVEVAEAATSFGDRDETLTPEENALRLHDELLDIARNAEQVLPTDASLNVDHYLYGAPKR